MTSSITVGKSTEVFHAKGYETFTSAAQYTVIWTKSPQTSASRDRICWGSHRCQLSSGRTVLILRICARNGSFPRASLNKGLHLTFF